MALFQSNLCSTYQQQNSSGAATAATAVDAFDHLNLQDYIASQRNRRQRTGRDSSTCTQVVWIFFWLLVLLLVAYPLALLASVFYVVLIPFSLISCLKPVAARLLACLNFPLTCAENMVAAKQLIIM